MKTVKDVFIEYKAGLINLYSVNEIEAITLLVINEITGFSKAKVKAFPEFILSADQLENLQNILNKLKTGQPVQYVLGKTEFYGLPFIVNPSVLIPRPETEELVEWVIASINSSQLAVGNILDIGTGSGCIAISLKDKLNDYKVLGLDISSTALQTAKKNADLNKVNVDFIEADILNLNSYQISNFNSQFSIIISNPPYVTMRDKTQMHTNVINFEPHNALFVPENDPLVFYKAIADLSSEKLVKDGLLFLEINEDYGEQLVELLANKSFKNIELRKDISGRDRMIRATIT